MEQGRSGAGWTVLRKGLLVLSAVVLMGRSGALVAQDAAAGAPAPASPRVVGTVVSVAADGFVVKPDKPDGIAAVTVSMAPGAKVLQLSPGSTDLKTAQPAQLSDVAAGDRVLVNALPAAAGAGESNAASLTARRVVLMKSTAISQQHEAEAGDWQRRGAGGIVTAMDASTGSLTISSGTRKIAITTTPKTIFRHYSQGSVRFADAVKGTLANVHPGDQLRVRGEHSADGLTIQAEEIVSGSFENVSGTILNLDTSAHTLSLKDLRTKKVVTIQLAETTSVRTLPKDVAERVAARGKTGGGPGGHGGSAAARTGAPGTPPNGEAPPAQHGSDFNQIVSRLPETPVGDLHKGEAVMIVGMPKSGSGDLIAVTLLAGVEPILAANPNGEADATLSPWNLGGAPEGGS